MWQGLSIRTILLRSAQASALTDETRGNEWKGKNTMATTVVLHHVKDYQAWRQVYDSIATIQKASGVVAESVYQGKGDPNNVLVLHRFATMDAAETFFANPELREAMQRGGVEGAPRIEFFEEA